MPVVKLEVDLGDFEKQLSAMSPDDLEHTLGRIVDDPTESSIDLDSFEFVPATHAGAASTVVLRPRLSPSILGTRMNLIAQKPFRAGRRSLHPGDKFEAHRTFGEAYITTGHAVEDLDGLDPATYDTRVMVADVGKRRRGRPRKAEII